MRTSTRTLLGSAIVLLLGLGLNPAPAGASLSGKASIPMDPGFDRYDSNDDGRVSAKEFEAREGAGRSFAAADGNHDGDLDQEEYIKAVSVGTLAPDADYASDWWISTKVRSRLYTDPMLDGVRIDVDTEDRTVQLSGELDDRAQIRRALRLTSQVQGVKGIDNDLRLRD